MKIHFLCNDGSPIGILLHDIYDRGVGGAENALLSLAEQFAKEGHDATIYNDPKSRGEEGGIKFRMLNEFKPDDPNRVLIVFRSPNHRAEKAKAIRKLWWSTDQFTIGNFATFSGLVDFVVTISPFHTAYHQKHYHIPLSKMYHIDLGVRDEYPENIKKKKKQLIYCSVPSRGLSVLYAAWPLILRDVPGASLVITSDYRLWGVGPGNHYHRLMWSDADNVSFVGKVPRHELLKLQAESEILAYPCTYEELFCISLAECQVAGAFPVTSAYGALPTTNEYGVTILGTPLKPDFVEEFVERIVSLLTDEREYLEERQKVMMAKAPERFSWARIAQRWYELIETGDLER